MSSLAFRPLEIRDGETPEDTLHRIATQGERLVGHADIGGDEKSEIVWQAWGNGPPLVLLHGGYGTWRHWIHVIPALSQRWRVYAADMPGFGESGMPADRTNPTSIAQAVYESLAEILAAHPRSGQPDMSKLGQTQPVTICGFSFGGVIAGHLARIFADQGRADMCHGLVLVAPGGLGAPRGQMPDLVRRSRRMTKDEIIAAHRRNLEILMVADPAVIDPLALFIQAMNTEQHRVKSRPISATDTLARAIDGLPIPIKAIFGALDATVGPYLPERIAIFEHCQPSVQVRVEPGVGHWIMYEAPQAFIEHFDALITPPPA